LQTNSEAFQGTTDKQLAYALLRSILGMNIAVHGLSRIYTGVKPFAAAMVPLFAKTPLPPASVYFYAASLPFVEAVIGLFVLFGFASRYAYIAGGLVILSLTFGSTLRQDWEASGLQLIYALLYAILLATREYNKFSIDGWLTAIREQRTLS
jgi:thiosulfate dehydrogenase (quinone) large subunit